ncbi:hypothetical protein [uncultured Tessaracoccus sp.]|uniref:hypothetical protein n=1 Tax=uncultured Tessaracoccus sp. TaxID=905023 RepID=UPI0025FDE0B8|nr:hypothetical protein [uncultured Tessaracoccus sp.]
MRSRVGAVAVASLLATATVGCSPAEEPVDDLEAWSEGLREVAARTSSVSSVTVADGRAAVLAGDEKGHRSWDLVDMGAATGADTRRAPQVTWDAVDGEAVLRDATGLAGTCDDSRVQVDLLSPDLTVTSLHCDGARPPQPADKVLLRGDEVPDVRRLDAAERWDLILALGRWLDADFRAELIEVTPSRIAIHGVASGCRMALSVTGSDRPVTWACTSASPVLSFGVRDWDARRLLELQQAAMADGDITSTGALEVRVAPDVRSRTMVMTASAHGSSGRVTLPKTP